MVVGEQCGRSHGSDAARLVYTDDPVSSGLVLARIFGIEVPTLLTLLVIPILYYAWLKKKAGCPPTPGLGGGEAVMFDLNRLRSKVKPSVRT